MNCAENKELAQKAKEIRKLTLTSIAKVGKRPYWRRIVSLRGDECPVF